jgi:hypothetical protein
MAADTDRLTQHDIASEATSPRARVPIPKFANPCGTSDANFGIKGTLANISFLCGFLDLKFLYELATIMEGNSDPPHSMSTERNVTTTEVLGFAALATRARHESCSEHRRQERDHVLGDLQDHGGSILVHPDVRFCAQSRQRIGRSAQGNITATAMAAANIAPASWRLDQRCEMVARLDDRQTVYCSIAVRQPERKLASLPPPQRQRRRSH